VKELKPRNVAFKIQNWKDKWPYAKILGDVKPVVAPVPEANKEEKK
jgi:hypothetical protein